MGAERVRGLRNLILSKSFQFLAISSFKRLHKRAKCHSNGVEIALFSEKLQILSTTSCRVLSPNPQLWVADRFEP